MDARRVWGCPNAICPCRAREQARGHSCVKYRHSIQFPTFLTHPPSRPSLRPGDYRPVPITRKPHETAQLSSQIRTIAIPVTQTRNSRTNSRRRTDFCVRRYAASIRLSMHCACSARLETITSTTGILDHSALCAEGCHQPPGELSRTPGDSRECAWPTGIAVIS